MVYVCTYAHMYLRNYVCMGGWKDEWIHAFDTYIHMLSHVCVQ